MSKGHGGLKRLILKPAGIEFETHRKNNARLITLRKSDASDAGDDQNGVHPDKAVTPVTAVTLACGDIPTAIRRSGLTTRMADAKKTKALLLRLIPDEFVQLKEQSARTDRSMSDLIRAALKKMKIVELPPADFTETVVQLRLAVPQLLVDFLCLLREHRHEVFFMSDNKCA